MKPNLNLIIINPVDSLCEEHNCLIINQSGGLYNQGSHLSNAGAKLVLGQIPVEKPKTDSN
ncbi:SGNH hydrolase domain-containing protein [Yersinia enterocolitica]